MKDIGVVNAPGGAPSLELSGGALERLKAITPKNHEVVIHVSLSDEPPLAKADVIIEARPKD
jgi:holo-[acyl-carrier protein] synthase